MNSTIWNHFSNSIHTSKSIDIEKTEDCLTKRGSGESNSSIKELVIGNDLFHNIKDHLVISNYPKLEKLWIKQTYMSNIESLTICDNEQLREIVVEGIEEKKYCEDDYGKVNLVVLKGSFQKFDLMFISSQSTILYNRS